MESTLVPYSACHELPARSVLVLAPHPDDEVFGCGGAIIRHLHSGCPVSVIVVSDGAFGADENQLPHVILTREAESCAAAALLGYPAPTFWRLPDRGIEYGELLVSRVMQAINSSNADLVYAPALSEMHPDHRSLAMVAVEAARRLGARVRLAMYEVGVPLSPNVLLDITSVAALKLQAMRCFKSQLTVQAYDDHIVALNRFRTYTLPANVRMAEAFRLHNGSDLSLSTLPLFESEYVRQSKLGLPLWGARDIPLISVVVHSMCTESLKDALDSLSLQTYQNIEVVVVNARGGEHPPIGLRCGRFPMRLICDNEGPLTQSDAINAGLSNTTGEFLAFLDDESVLDPDHYSSLVEVWKSHVPNCVIAYSGVRTKSRRGRNATVTQECMIQTEVNLIQLLFGGFVSVNALLVPRTLFANGVMFDEELIPYEHSDFWIQLADLAPFIYSGRVTAATHHSPEPLCVNKGQLKFLHKWVLQLDENKLSDLSRFLLKKEAAYLENLLQLQLKSTAQDQLRTSLTDMQVKVDSLSTKNMELVHKVTQLEQFLVIAQDEIQALRTSTSWRLTGPMRFFVRQFLRLIQLSNFHKSHRIKHRTE